MSTDKQRLAISELEKKSGVPRSTIQFYIKEGLLPKADKTGRTMAYYNVTHLRRLEAIQKIKIEYLKNQKSSRVPISEIKHQLQSHFSFGRGKAHKNSGARKHTRELRNERKEEIIKAALRLYTNRGYYLTNVRDICREAGISSPTFYHYFPDKRELFVEAIEYVIGKYQEELEQALAKEDDLVKRTIIIFSTFAENYPRVGEILNQLRAGVIIDDPWAKDRLNMVYRQVSRILVKEIERGIEDGLVRKKDPELLAFFLIAIGEAEIQRAALDDKHSLLELAIFGADLQYKGMLTPKGRKALGY